MTLDLLDMLALFGETVQQSEQYENGRLQTGT